MSMPTGNQIATESKSKKISSSSKPRVSGTMDKAKTEKDYSRVNKFTMWFTFALCVGPVNGINFMQPKRASEPPKATASLVDGITSTSVMESNGITSSEPLVHKVCKACGKGKVQAENPDITQCALKEDGKICGGELKSEDFQVVHFSPGDNKLGPDVTTEAMNDKAIETYVSSSQNKSYAAEVVKALFNGEVELLFAFLNGEPAGVVQFEFLPKDSIYVKGVDVLEQHRLRGIGRAMMNTFPWSYDILLYSAGDGDYLYPSCKFEVEESEVQSKDPNLKYKVNMVRRKI